MYSIGREFQSLEKKPSIHCSCLKVYHHEIGNNHNGFPDSVYNIKRVVCVQDIDC